MPNSQHYTAKDVWREATRDLVGNDGELQVIDIERFNIINRAVDQVVGTFYGYVKNNYLTEQLLMTSLGGNYWAGGAFTNTLIINDGTYLGFFMGSGGMYAPMSNADVGKYCVFRVGANVYIGKITTVNWAALLATFTVKSELHFPMTGFPLVVNEMLILPSVVENDEIDLGTTRIASGGVQSAIVLKSSTGKATYPVDVDEFTVFDSAAERNASKIVYCITDNKIRMKTSSTGYGSLTLYYPRLPILLISDTDFLDVPDGILVTMVISITRKIVGDRMNIKGAFNPAEMQALVYDFMKQYDVNVKLQEVKEKTHSLS